MNRNSKNGFLLGYGYIEMEDENSVEIACKLDKSTFKGRKINVAKSIPKSKFYIFYFFLYNVLIK